MWYIWFVIPSALLFIFSTLFVGVLDDLIVLQTLVIVLLSFLLLPIYYDSLPRRWAVGRKVRIHVIYSLSVIALLQLGYSFRLGVMKDKSYDYRFGYYSGPFRMIYSTKPAQLLLSSLYDFAPLKYRIGLYRAEDLKRVSLLRKEIDSDHSRSLICYDKDASWCFLQVIKSSTKVHPTGTAGTLALLDAGAYFLKEENQKHPDRLFQHVQKSSELLQLVSGLSTSSETELKNLIPGFPSDTKEPTLKKLVKKEKKIRFTLAHQPPIFQVKGKRGLAGKFK